MGSTRFPPKYAGVGYRRMSAHTPDIEWGRERINGFPSVAAKIDSDKDKTTTLYRRFDRLSARNILFLQAELAELEAELDVHDANDLRDGDLDTKRCHSDWRQFVKCAQEDCNGRVARPRERTKMDLAMKVRDKLKEYRWLMTSPITRNRCREGASST